MLVVLVVGRPGGLQPAHGQQAAALDEPQLRRRRPRAVPVAGEERQLLLGGRLDPLDRELGKAGLGAGGYADAVEEHGDRVGVEAGGEIHRGTVPGVARTGGRGPVHRALGRREPVHRRDGVSADNVAAPHPRPVLSAVDLVRRLQALGGLQDP